jgi:hypothetical protein
LVRSSASLETDTGAPGLLAYGDVSPFACIVAWSTGSEYSPVAYSRNASRTRSARSGSRITFAISLPAIFSRTFR